MRLVIVGGGMAGLCAAISAAETMHMQDNIKGEILLLDAGKDDGLIPCGLGARDTLRMEASMPPRMTGVSGYSSFRMRV